MTTSLANRGPAVAALARAAQAHRRAEAAVISTRLALASAIAEADSAGVKQLDIVRITGYTRETVRRIVKSFEDETEQQPTA
jgi:CRP-like cAMP-binding protein